MEQDKDTYDLNRFIEAQNVKYTPEMTQYQCALKEIKAGFKYSHWIWFIFPQLHGLGFSSMCDRYGIRGLEEAKEYLKNETLRYRLVEISTALLMHGGKKTAEDILGDIDAVKVRSCMTLFAEAAWDIGLIAEYEQFRDVLEAFYGGEKDQTTIDMINSESLETKAIG